MYYDSNGTAMTCCPRSYSLFGHFTGEIERPKEEKRWGVREILDSFFSRLGSNVVLLKCTVLVINFYRKG